MNHPETTLLLIDDTPSNLQVLNAMLDGQGYRLLSATNGPDALKIVRQVQPTLVLLDIMMPEMDGFEVCTRLKESPETADIAVIFLSALADTESKIRGLKLGAVDYISKPFQPEEVLARVETHVRIRELEQLLLDRNRQLEADYERIMEAVDEGIYSIDRDGLINGANPAAMTITGYSWQQLKGKSFHALHQQTLWDGTPFHESQSAILSVLESGEGCRNDNEVFWTDEGMPVAVEYQCAPVSKDGYIDGVVIAFQDISDRKRQERKLRKALDQISELKERLQDENAYLQEEIRTEQHFGDIIGKSAGLKTVLDMVERVARTDSSVMIFGESGTGKESIARAIHDLSNRNERPLVKLNCGAISANLIESELFGHEKGSFTGALTQRKGRFELADGGSLFLDEIGEMPADAQVKLLRVLQEQEFERVGGSETLKVDVRVIAATNRNLADMVDAGTFRQDLYYRLNVFPLHLPPLRARKQDIPLLVDVFLQRMAQRVGKSLRGLSDASMRLLMNYDWPGNIRELQNVIERSAILATSEIIEIEPLHHSSVSAETPPPVATAAPAGTGENEMADGEILTLAEQERRYITAVLDQLGWTIGGQGGAAECLGVPASTLRSRMKKLGVTRR